MVWNDKVVVLDDMLLVWDNLVVAQDDLFVVLDDMLLVWDKLVVAQDDLFVVLYNLIVDMRVLLMNLKQEILIF